MALSLTTKMTGRGAQRTDGCRGEHMTQAASLKLEHSKIGREAREEAVHFLPLGRKIGHFRMERGQKAH